MQGLRRYGFVQISDSISGDMALLHQGPVDWTQGRGRIQITELEGEDALDLSMTLCLDFAGSIRTTRCCVTMITDFGQESPVCALDADLSEPYPGL